MTVSIVEVPTNAVVIEMHSIRSPSGIKNGIWQRSCDYMIVFRSGEQDGVLFVELKQTLRDATLRVTSNCADRGRSWIILTVCAPYTSKPI